MESATFILKRITTNFLSVREVCVAALKNPDRQAALGDWYMDMHSSDASILRTKAMFSFFFLKPWN